MKSLKVALAALLMLSIVSWWSCNQDPKNLESRLVDTAFAGRVIDENNAPVIGAQVQVGTETVTTDNNGVFRTKKVRLADNNAILKVTQAGYFDFSRAYFVEDDALQPVTIQLLRKTLVGLFDNASGATINVPGGPKLKFPANAVDVSGTVRVYARYLNPTDPKLNLFMPGDLRAIAANGEEQTLGTFGMVAVELEGNAGKAQIAPGMEVEMTMPIAAAQASQAPAEIALWHFDTEQARWIEEGTAQKSGNTYVGKVKHFSFWNCDVGLPLVQLSGTVYLNDEQHPLEGATVTLTTTSSLWPGYAYTNENGQYGGGVIKDEEMVLTVQFFSQCGTTLLYTQTVGPFTDNTVLPPIIITGSLVGSVEISGKLETCAGTPVTNGYAKLGDFDVAFADANGEFSHSMSNCLNIPSINVQAFDFDNLKESPVQAVNIPSTGGNVDLGTITVCTGLDEYIQYNLDGTTFTIADPYAFVSDSVGIPGVFISHFNGTTTYVYMAFDAEQAGTYPLVDFRVNSLFALPNSPITTTVTQYPDQIGGYFLGTFTGTFQTEQGGSHTVSGSYRVKRE